MDSGRDHSSNNWSRNRFHYVRSDPGFPEYRSQAQNDCSHGHQLRTESLNRTVNGRFLDLRFGEPDCITESVLQCFVQVYDHHDTGFHGYSKQGYVADPDCHAEVVAE